MLDAALAQQHGKDAALAQHLNTAAGSTMQAILLVQ
jgi:hypothetical protein